MINKEEYTWLQAHENLMYKSISSTPAAINYIYSIFNRITGLNKRPNHCGSCLRNTISTVRQSYEKYKETNG